MNKLGRREYIQLIADTLVDKYGSTLKEYGTDVEMAEAVFRKLKKYLYIHPNDISKDKYERWKSSRNPFEEDK